MSKINRVVTPQNYLGINVPQPVTHEGGRAVRIGVEEELRRAVMSCLLWENTFYESGEDIATRISKLVKIADQKKVAEIAVEARSKMNLRHVPLLLCREMARTKSLKPETLAAVIQRPDELTEYLAIYWKNGREKLSAASKKGLALAFPKFNEYSLGKYNQTDKPVKLRDVLFLSHAKPKDEEQAALWKRLIDGTIATPDTWEVSLSAGADKKETWQRLMAEGKLGALALLRNLRNMQSVGVDVDLIREALGKADVRRVLPFRFIAAARYAPQLEPDLEACMFRSIEDGAHLKGSTGVLVDVSDSMDAALSAKSEMTRIDAACGVAMIVRELTANVRVFAFSDRMVEIAPRRGFALRDAIKNSMPHGGTNLGAAISLMPQSDRLIVISDEQAHDNVEGVNATKAYMLNVGGYKNGVGYGAKWTNISGFSESVVKYMLAVEG